MSDLCHVQWMLKFKTRVAWTCWRNVERYFFNRSKCWMIWIYLNAEGYWHYFSAQTFHKHSSWSTGEMDSTHDFLAEKNWHLTQIQRFSTRLTIFEPWSPEPSPNPEQKETHLNTWHEHISWTHRMSSMNIESQAVLRIEVGEKRLKKVATKKLTPHCLGTDINDINRLQLSL